MEATEGGVGGVWDVAAGGWEVPNSGKVWREKGQWESMGCEKSRSMFGMEHPCRGSGLYVGVQVGYSPRRKAAGFGLAR